MAQLVGSNSLGLGKLIDGKNQFVHIMYSANADGSNMTADIQADTKYIGIVTSNSETAPTNPSDYSWGRFVGTSGTSSYTWLRYSPNEDGSNMTANPTSETKYIGVAITADNNAPTDYTKYSWALIKGDDGRGISKTEVTYQKSTSGTVIPTGTWVTTIPTVNAGEYLWTRTLFTYTDNTTSSTYSVARSGVTGLGISRSDVDYQKSTSGTVAPTGAWTATIPTVAANEYLWTRTTLTYTNATTSVSYSVGKMGADGKDAQLLYLTASSQIQAFDKDDKPKTTQAITISAKLQNASGTATFVAIPYIGNVAQTAITLGGTGNDRTLLPSQWTNTQWTTIAITATLGSLTDTISVIKVKDGATGPKGDQGNQGIQGPPGPDGKPTYIHWAYAWSSDGTDRFTTQYPNENNLIQRTITGGTNQGKIVPMHPNSTTGGSMNNSVTITELPNRGIKLTVTATADPYYRPLAGIKASALNMTKMGISFRYEVSDTARIRLRVIGTGTTGSTSGTFYYTGSGQVNELVDVLPSDSGVYISIDILGINASAGIVGTEATINELKISDGNALPYTPSPGEDFANAYPTYAGTYTDNELIDSEDPTKYTWQRILGDEGESASSYWITPSVNVIKKSMIGLLSPTTITFSAFTKKGLEDSIPYSGRFVIFTSADGVIWTNRYTATTDSTSYTYTIPSNVNFVRARVYQAGATTALLDETNVPIIEDVNGLELGNRNYFSIKAWNNKPPLTSSAVPYMEVKLEPNTQYTLSTNIPKQTAGGYDVFFFKGTDVISSASNGVAKGEPRTLTTNADGIVKVGMRNYDLSQNYWIMLSQGNKALDWTSALEDAQLYTAWSNSPDGKDMVRVYPNENILLGTTSETQTLTTTSGWPDKTGATNALMAVGPDRIIKHGETYTYSAYITAPKDVRAYIYVRLNRPGAPNGSYEDKTSNRLDAGTSGWCKITVTIPNDTTSVRFTVGRYENNTATSRTLSWSQEKAEKGSEQTAWTAAPSENPVKAEMSYVGYSPINSNNPSDYVWQENPKAKGTFKRWANSPDGTLDFIAQYPNENLFTITRPEVKNPAATKAEFLNNPNWDMAPIFDSYGAGIPYTLSFDLKSAVAGPIQVYSQNGSGSKYNIGTTAVQATTEFKRFVVTFTPQIQSGTTQTQALLAFYGVYDSGRVPTVRNLKLELGPVATLDIPSVTEDLLATIPQYTGVGSKDSMNPADFVWTITPEYTQARTDLGLDTKVDDETFNDAQDHINEVIDGKADSQELQDLKDMADNLQQSYEGFVGEGGQHEADLLALQARLEGVIFELGEQVAAFDFIKTHMRLGEEGFEIAEEGSTMKMLLTNETLSFIDGGKEVASFSNQKFIINQGAIVESLQVGSHKMSRLSDKVTVFQYAPKTAVIK